MKFQKKILAYLELMRFPNLFTAAADVAAGGFIVRGSHLPWGSFTGLLAATVGFYAGGCVLNDLFDREVDKRERPQRPIPSGRVSVPEAAILAAVFMGTGLLGSFLAGRGAFLVGSLLALLIFSYDFGVKKSDILGPVNMGLCRSLNLMLGMSLGFSGTRMALVFPVFTLLYVLSLTTLSRFETGGDMGGRRRLVIGGWAIAFLGIFFLWVAGEIRPDGLWYLGGLLLLTGPPLYRALRTGRPDHVGKAVGMMVMGITLLDASYAAGVRGWPYGVPAALCGAMAWALSKRFYVT